MITKWKLFRLCMLYFGIEIMFSLEMALTVPLLLKLKVSEDYYSFVYFLSPLLSIVFQPILGMLSDRCQSKFGRRRPFIFALTMGAFVGITLNFNSFTLGQWLGDSEREIPSMAIFLTGVGVTLMDFAGDSCDTPLKAYLIDSCHSNRALINVGLNIHAFLCGIGAAFGYFFAGLDLAELFPKQDELVLLFLMASCILLFTLFITLTSVKERSVSSSTGPNDIFIQQDDYYSDNNVDQLVDARTLVKSLRHVPLSLQRLIVNNLLGWMAYFSTVLFFTDYVAQTIFEGNPTSNPYSIEYKNYDKGVKYGSWCLVIYTLGASVAALFSERLSTRFTIKSLYLLTYFVYAFSCLIMYLLPTLVIVMPLCLSFGLLQTSLLTLPYQLLTEFHKDQRYKNHSSPGTKRGIAIDVSLLATSYFLAQSLVSVLMSSWIKLFQSNDIILLAGFVFSLASFVWTKYFTTF